MISTVLFLLPAILILTLIMMFIILPWSRIQKYKKKGMSTYFFPVVGYLNYWNIGFKKGGDYFQKFKNASREFPDQKVLVTNLGQSMLFLLRDPQYAKDFYQKHPNYNKVGIVEFIKPLLGYGLIFAEGDTWKQHRKIISSFFHYESLKGSVPAMHKTAKHFLDKLTPEDFKNFSVINKIQEITGEIVGMIFFGDSLNSYMFEGKNLTLGLAQLIIDVVLNSFRPLSLMLGIKLVNIVPSHRKLMGRVKAFRGVINQMIQDRKASEHKGNDLLGGLLSSQQASDPSERLSDDHIIDEFVTFFTAGMDTTGHMIAMALYMLTQYPEYLQKLKEERDATFKKEEITNLDTLQKMEELHCFIKEVLRFHTPAPLMFDRVALCDHKIMDLDIPKGAWVKPDFYALFFNDKYFDNPEKFSPEMWKTNAQTLDPYSFTPFSAGPRNCIGQHLALIEAKIILSEFLERFDFKLKDGYKLKMVFRFLNEPSEELLFDLTPKKE